MRTLRAIGVVVALVCAGLVIGEAQQTQVPGPPPLAPIVSSGGAGAISSTVSQLTPASGTGITVNNPGEVRTQTYKVTVASTAFVCAAVTCDVTIATLPAKTFLSFMVAQLTQVFACASTCTSSTLSMTVGATVGTDSRFLASFDADAATMIVGDADAEMGVALARATAVQAGFLTAFGSSTLMVLRLTSGTGNLGDAVATNLSTGSVTFYLTATVLP